MKKRILITGSTDGIGKLAAIQLAKSGHELLIHGRNAEKLAQLKNELQSYTNESITDFKADFSDLKEVANMSIQIKERFESIDVIINNAGIFKSSSKIESGLDIRFVVNYLAPYLLTKELLDLLNQSADPRLINVSSAAQSPVSLNALTGAESLPVNEAYAQSKLALTMWTFAFAQEHKKITAIAVNPGSLLNTKMANEAYGQHWSPASKGADLLVDLAVSKEFDSATGKYFDNDKGNPRGGFSAAHPDAYDHDLIAKLLARTSEMVQEAN